MLGKLKWVALAVVLVLGIAAARVLPGLRQATGVGAGYVAHQMCSCIFVANRSYDSCRPDMLAVMKEIEVEVMDDPSGVRAWVPMLSERVALYEEGFGCTLQ